MNQMVRTYLHIPPDYRMGPTALRWSDDGDAIEGESGATFAFTHEIALFLQGFIAARRLIHFAYIVHLFRLLGLGRNFIDESAQPLRKLFHQAGGSLPNAGAFAAQLCPWAPAVAEPTDIDGTSRRWMTNTALLSFISRAAATRSLPEVPEALPYKPEVFAQRVRKALAAYTEAEIRHWFRHGRGPIKTAGEELARELEAVKPRTLAGVLAALAQRQRLAGAIPLVAQMVSALALPPRRLDQNELPLGGYADVTTHGQPEHLLPSQFAIDELEFVRRFASRELLYFRREEPHAQLREELVLLLDQGVRTWGDVRLVLSAAVFALGKRAVRSDVPLKLATTSNGGKLVDPLTTADEALGELVEASDLSLHPGEALEAVLLGGRGSSSTAGQMVARDSVAGPAEGGELSVGGSPSLQGSGRADAGKRPPGSRRPAAGPATEWRATMCPRDVVLLTHPRNLTEPDVAAAARCVPPATRLFALAVDDEGRAQLVEMRHGTPVALCQFRVDLSRIVPAEEPAPVVGPLPMWRGSVERVGFPFHFGITTRIDKFAFDRSGDWLLVASRNGILHAHRTDGSCTEVLPRGVLHNDVLTDVDAVLGLAGGFVVGGRLDMELVAIHYHFPERRCVAHVLGAAEGKRWQWFYLPQFHCVVVRHDRLCYGVDLATGERGVSVGPDHRPGSRVAQACNHVWHYGATSEPFRNSDNPGLFSARRLSVRLDAGTGTLHVATQPEPVRPGDVPTCQIRQFMPLADGRPVFQGGRILMAQHGGNVLAVSAYAPAQPEQVTLRLFGLSEGTPICEYPQQRSSDAFTLSGDGRYLARQIGEMQVAIHDLASGSEPVSVTPVGKCHQNLTVELGDFWLTLGIGDRIHLLRWERGLLVIQPFARGREAEMKHLLRGLKLRYPGAIGGSWGEVCYDAKRFVRGARSELIVSVDVFGQVAVWSAARELLCMFFVFRDKVAAWMPDGTRFGPAWITGSPATPGALGRIGGVLRRASPLWVGGEP